MVHIRGARAQLQRDVLQLVDKFGNVPENQISFSTADLIVLAMASADPDDQSLTRDEIFMWITTPFPVFENNACANLLI